MRIYSASQLAAVVGENPYENACDILESLWKKEDTNGYFRSLKRNNPHRSFQSDQDTLYKALKSEDTIDIIKKAEEKQDISEKVNLIASTTTNLDEHSEKLVKKHIKSRFSTVHGTKNEKSALELYSENTNQNAQKYNTIITTKIDESICLRGKIDGVIKDSHGNIEKIIEIKNRTKKLFYTVRMYEMIQIQAYMHMLKIHKSDLVEHYKGSLHVCNIDYDDSFFEKILKRLKRFDECLNSIIGDQEYQKGYFTSEDRNAFIFSSKT